MTMPHASASLIPDHDDSVENDKDFAPPPKKLKGEEEDNTPGVPMSQDSVGENDKDFAKLKGEEEEDNTPVVPMSRDSVEENDKDFAKLKGEEEEDHTPVVPMSQDSDSDEEEEEEKEKPPFTEDEARKAFDLWHLMYKVKYADQSEYEKRFNFFKDTLLRKVHHCWRRYAMNTLSLADRSPEEILASGDYCDITIQDIHDFYKSAYIPW